MLKPLDFKISRGGCPHNPPPPPPPPPPPLALQQTCLTPARGLQAPRLEITLSRPWNAIHFTEDSWIFVLSLFFYFLYWITKISSEKWKPASQPILVIGNLLLQVPYEWWDFYFRPKKSLNIAYQHPSLNATDCVLPHFPRRGWPGGVGGEIYSRLVYVHCSLETRPAPSDLRKGLGIRSLMLQPPYALAKCSLALWINFERKG